MVNYIKCGLDEIPVTNQGFIVLAEYRDDMLPLNLLQVYLDGISSYKC